MIYDDRTTTEPLWIGRRRALGILLLLLLVIAGVIIFSALLRDGSPAISGSGNDPAQPLVPAPTSTSSTPAPSTSPTPVATPDPAPRVREQPPVFVAPPEGGEPPTSTPPAPPEGSLTILVSGDATRLLRPGVSAPLDVSFSNTADDPITVTVLEVGIRSIDAPNATAGFPCTVADYFVQQVAAGFTVVVPTGTNTLSALGTAESRWPRVGMLSTSHDQRGCADAVVNFDYSVSGRTS